VAKVKVIAGSCHWTGSSEGRMTDAGLGLRDQVAGRLAMVTDVWGHRGRATSYGDLRLGTSASARVHGVTVLTKSRRRSCQSSGGSGRLGRAVEDVGDTRRGSEDRCMVFKFGPQN